MLEFAASEGSDLYIFDGAEVAVDFASSYSMRVLILIMLLLFNHIDDASGRSGSSIDWILLSKRMNGDILHCADQNTDDALARVFDRQVKSN